jgi:hypothetical protein
MQPLDWHLIKKRFQPYAGLISFVGAAVVVGTFIVRDVLRDHERDLLSGLETAKAGWILQQSLNGLEWRILTVQDQINNLVLVNDTYAKSGESPNHLDSNSIRLVNGEKPKEIFLSYSLMYWHRQMEVDKVLYEKLSPHRRKVHQFKIEILKLYYDWIESKVSNGTHVQIPGLPDIWLLSEIPPESKKEIAERAALLWAGIFAEMQDLLEDFETETKHAAHLFRTFTYASWMLYAVGTVVGFLGQVAGVNGRRDRC